MAERTRPSVPLAPIAALGLLAALTHCRPPPGASPGYGAPPSGASYGSPSEGTYARPLPVSPGGYGARSLSEPTPGATSASPTGAANATEAASAPTSTTIELHSDCPTTIPIFLGEKPKFGSGTRSTIGSNTTTSVARSGGGSLTVWIIDDHENGIASARATPTTKRIEIDRSCKSITAR